MLEQEEFASLKQEVNKLPEDQRALFLEDMGHADDEWVLLLKNEPLYCSIWSHAAQFKDIRRNADSLRKIGQIEWKGSVGGNLQFERINDGLTEAHPVPSQGKEGIFDDLITDFHENGYDINDPYPILVIELPDGTSLISNGHHRLKVLKDMGVEIAPIERLSWDQAVSKFEPNTIAIIVELSRRFGFYKGEIPELQGVSMYYVNRRVDTIIKENFPNFQK